MKLHLPCTLRQAVMSCLALASSLLPVSVASGALALGTLLLTLPAQARQLTTEHTDVHQTLHDNLAVDAVYSGRIFQASAGGNIHEVSWTYGADNFFAEGSQRSGFTIAGMTAGTCNGELAGSQPFWRNVWTSAAVGDDTNQTWGHTMWMNGGGGNFTLTLGFSPLTLGGLISYGSGGWNNLITDSGARPITLQAVSDEVGVRVQVTKNLEIKITDESLTPPKEYNTNDPTRPNYRITVASDSEWAVWGGYTMQTRRYNVVVSPGKTLTLSRISGSGNANVNILNGGSLVLERDGNSGGGKLVVQEGVSLTIDQDLEMIGAESAPRVTNNGSISLRTLRVRTNNITPNLAGSGTWTFVEGGSIVNMMAIGGNMTFINGAESGITLGEGDFGAALSVTSGNTLTWNNNLNFTVVGAGMTFGSGQFHFTSAVSLAGGAAVTVAAGAALSIDGGLSLAEGFTMHGAASNGTGVVKLNGGTLSMGEGSVMDNMFTLSLAGNVTLAGAGTISGAVSVAADADAAPTVALADEARITVGSTGTKDFGDAGLHVVETSTLVVANLSGWQSAVYGEGTVEMSLNNLTNWTAGNMESAQALFSGAAMANLHLMEGTLLCNTNSDALGNVQHIVVENGAALNLRAGADATFSSVNTTLELNGEAEATPTAGGASCMGALIAGAGSGQGVTLALNSNLELGSDSTVCVTDGSGTPYTLVLGSEDAGANALFTAHDRTLSKTGAGALRLGARFMGASGDSGSIYVREGSLELATNAPEAATGYGVFLENGTKLHLTANLENIDETYIIARLGGSGTVTAENHYTLAFKNEDASSNNSNTFTGTLGDTSSSVSVRMLAGYQKLAAEVVGSLDIELGGGMLDINGIQRDNAVLNVLVTDRNAQIDGLVLLSSDVLDMNDVDAAFNVTMKGGSIMNAGAYAGVIYVDDSGAGVAATNFDLQGISAAARVTLRSLHVGSETSSTITTDSLTLGFAGTSTITLGKWVEEGQEGFEHGVIYFVPERGKISVDMDSVISLSLSEVVNDIVAKGEDGLLFRLSNRSIAGLEDSLSFGAELALFNLKVSFAEETGCLRFSTLSVNYDNVYRSTENNDGSAWNAEGNDVYESTDRFVAVYVDKATQVDLTGASMGRHTDGLVLKNLMGSSEGQLTVVGDGSGKSKITLRNNLSNEQLAQLSEEMGVKLENMLTYSGNIDLTDTDLQVKHQEADSVTQMHGRLTMNGDSAVEMTSGVLELTSKGNVLGESGTTFFGNEGQLYLHGASATMGGEIVLVEPDENEVTLRSRTEHVLMSHGAQLTLNDSSLVGAGVVIGNAVAHVDNALNGTVTIAGNTGIEAGAAVRNVLLHLAAGSRLNVGGLYVEPEVDEEVDGFEEFVPAAISARDFEPQGDTVAWQVSGLTGSGTLSSAMDQDIIISVEKETRTFSGDLSNFQGLVTVVAGEHAQEFVGVKGGTGFFLQNAKGGKMLLDLMGDRKENTLVMGGLTMATGSQTTILMDLHSVDGDSGLQLGSLNSQSGANVTVGHYAGSMRVDVAKADAQGEVIICLGRVDGEMDQTLNWELTGVRNMKENAYRLWVEHAEDGTSYLYAAVLVEQGNKWGEHTGGGNAGAGSSMLWGVEDSGSVGGDLAALDGVISGLLDGDNWKTPGNVEKANRILAAAAGSSTAVLGQALVGDLDRQLRAIRNRTTSMGYNELENQYAELPRWSAWVNAEGNYVKQKADGMLPGYKMNGWGGTVGAVVDTSESVSVGLALTAMYNDLDSEGPDTLSSNMDNYYLSAFARMTSGSWLHTLVASFGISQVDTERTVDYGEASYTVNGDSQGFSAGFMYEVGYGIALNNLGTVCMQPVFNVAWRYVTLDAYDEEGSTAALSVGRQTYSTLTFGLGARLQALVGGNIFNHSGLLETRALLKLDVGDRQGKSSNAFRYAPEGNATVKGVERGMAGFELGAGMSVPLGAERGDVFFDVSADIRSKATEFNATVGYKVSF